MEYDHVGIQSVSVGGNPVSIKQSGLAEAYQLAATEIERVQKLPWTELAPCADAPWRFNGQRLATLPDAQGRLSIVDGFDGDPAVKQIIVALEFRHVRQGRRTVRLVTLVNRVLEVQPVAEQRARLS
ncbi:MAG TPA: hypothetical protein VGM37_13985 [Armatimonadota bacterium]|jgi:hypothetical protein